MNKFLQIVFLIMLSSGSLLANENKLSWKALPGVPDKLGVAGPFAGVHNNVLIVAGGANFPKGEPWRITAEGYNSPKVYHDKIYIITRNGTEYSIDESPTTLPQKTGYGLSLIHI